LSVSTNINQPVVLMFAGNDPNNLLLTYSVVDSPSQGTVLLDNGDWVYTPAQDYIGTDSFTYNASNGTYSSEPVIVNISVLEA
jgi:hypothetical protein